MQKYRDNVTIQGRGGLIPVRNANVTVYNNGTNNPAIIYTNVQKTPKANPFQADALGAIFFYAENGRYDLLIQGDGQSLRIDDILMEDVWEEVDELEVEMVTTSANAQNALTQSTNAMDRLDDLADETDPAKGASDVGYKLDAAHTVGRTQAEVNGDFVSVTSFTDVDRLGILDSTFGFLAAAAYSRLTGNEVEFPSGTYKISSAIDVSNVKFRFAPGAIIDARTLPGSYVFRALGSAGTEIPLSVNAARGDDTITTATPHGLAKGDWFLIISQRACSHADAGVDWQLGTTTGSGTQAYFAEPMQVLSVDSTTQVTTTTPLIFPSYRIDNTQETLVGGRTQSTIRKIDFATVRFLGFPEILAPEKYAISFQGQWLYKPRVEANFTFGDFPGTGFYAQYVYDGLWLGSADRPIDWTLVGDHSQYNSFRDVSTWYNKMVVSERHGAQCYDQSYVNYCSIWPEVDIRSFDSHEQGMTTHGNTYGIRAKVLAVNHIMAGVTNRARWAEFDITSIGRADSSNSNGITLSEWGQQDFRIKMNSKNNAYTFNFDKSSTSITDSPEVISGDITGTIDSPTIGAFVFRRRTVNGVKPNRINIHDLKCRNTRLMVFCENTHWHGLNFNNIDIMGARDTGVARLFAFGNDSSFHTLKNIRVTDCQTTYLLYCPRFNDSALSAASYGKALTVDWNTIDLKDSTCDLMDGFNSTITLANAQDVITRKLFNQRVALDLTNTTGARTLTLNTGFVNVMPVGSYLELVMRGTALLIVVAGAGATIYGETASVAQGDVVKVYRTGSAAYVVQVS